MLGLDPPEYDGPDLERCSCGVHLVEHDDAGGLVCPVCDLNHDPPDDAATEYADYLLDQEKDVPF